MCGDTDDAVSCHAQSASQPRSQQLSAGRQYSELRHERTEQYLAARRGAHTSIVLCPGEAVRLCAAGAVGRTIGLVDGLYLAVRGTMRDVLV